MDITESWVYGCFSRAANFRCCVLPFQASYDHVLPPAEAKGSENFFVYFLRLPLEAAISIFSIRFSC
jgi:hypothetical protein